MNSLSQLIDDLSLDEAKVLLRLRQEGLVSPLCCFLEEVSDQDCPAAREFVLGVLRGEDWESVVTV